MVPMFEFKNRWTGEVIDSQEAETLREALEILVRKKANLGGANLEEANLWGANLRGANLEEANLRYANLWGANLRGANLEKANLEKANLGKASLGYANLRGATIGLHTLDSLLTRVTRSDNYEFIAFRTSTKEVLIRAGCRTILGTDAYRKHIEKNYSGTPKARETLKILEFIDSMISEKFLPMMTTSDTTYIYSILQQLREYTCENYAPGDLEWDQLLVITRNLNAHITRREENLRNKPKNILESKDNPNGTP